MTADTRSKSPFARFAKPLVAVAVIVLIGVVWYATRSEPGQGAGPGPGFRSAGGQPVPVRVATAEEEPLTVRIRALGTVTPLNMVTVRSRVEGELVRLAFEEGQMVRAGDLLAEIDPRAYQVQLAQVRGSQAQNLAELENARGVYQRLQDLQAGQYVSAQDVSNQAALVRQLEGRRDSDRAAVDEAQLQLDYTRITAPVSGRVGLRAVDVGNLVRANDTEGLVTITQTSPISVLFTIPEVELPSVIDAVRSQPGLPVEIWDREERRQLTRGELSSIDNLIDPSTSTLRLRAVVANEDESLFPNQFVNVRLQVSEQPALVIPDAAVQFGSGGTFVYVVGDEDTASLRNVTLGASDGARIAVLDGLVAGERVVLEGLDRLREGSPVLIIEEATDSATGSGDDA